MTDNQNIHELEVHAAQGTPVPKSGQYKVRVDDKRYVLDDPKPTGRQLIDLTGVRPIDEYLIFLKLRGGGFEEIRLNETVDLTRNGTERFLTFDSAASYRFEIDGERIEWGAKLITGLRLKQIAGVDPVTYALWREVRRAEDQPVSDDDMIDLSEEGLERFFTVIEKTTAGDAMNGGVLPRRDVNYLGKLETSYEVVQDQGRTAVILRNYKLAGSKFDSPCADVLIVVPPGFPDVPPDMFYCKPWLKLTERACYPTCADVPFHFSGVSWQRWSRHNSQWRPGKDGIWTMIKRVDRALAEAK